MIELNQHAQCLGLYSSSTSLCLGYRLYPLPIINCVTMSSKIQCSAMLLLIIWKNLSADLWISDEQVSIWLILLKLTVLSFSRGSETHLSLEPSSTDHIWCKLSGTCYISCKWLANCIYINYAVLLVECDEATIVYCLPFFKPGTWLSAATHWARIMKRKSGPILNTTYVKPSLKPARVVGRVYSLHWWQFKYCWVFKIALICRRILHAGGSR